MAQRLNKKLVVGLTIAGMAVTTLGGVFMVYSMPQKDPKPMAEQAEKFAAEGKYEDAADYYKAAWQRSRAQSESSEQTIGYLMKVGDMSLAAGKDREARGAWGSVLLTDPNNVGAQEKILSLNLEIARLGAGALHWRQGVQQEAQKLCDMTEYANLVGLHALGLAMSELSGTGDEKDAQNTADAEKYLRKAFEAEKTNPEFAESLGAHYHRVALRNLSIAFQQMSGIADAESAYATAIEKANDVYQTLLNALTQETSKDPKVMATAWRYRGEFNRTVRETVATIIEQKQKNRPDPAGEARLRKIMTDADAQALECLTKAVEFSPDEPEALVAVGNYWATRRSTAADDASRATEESGFRAKARENFEAAIEKARDSFDGYLRLAALYRQQKEYDKAIEALQPRIALKLVRSGYRQWRNKMDMSTVLATAFEINLQKLEDVRRASANEAELKAKSAPIIEAMTQLQKDFAAEQLEGNKNPQAMLMAAHLSMAQGNDVEAIVLLRDTEKLVGSEVPQIKLMLGDLYVKTGQPGAARDELRKLLSMPTYAQRLDSAWAKLAIILADMPEAGREALEAAQNALAINPNNVQALMAQSTIYGKQKNLEGMAEVQRKILELTGTGQSEVNDKVLRTSILLTRAYEDAATPNQTLVAEAKLLLREVLSINPGHLQALQIMVQLLAQDKSPASFAEAATLLDKAKAAVQQPPTDSPLAALPPEQRDGLLAMLDRLRVASDPQTSEDEKIRQMEEIVRHQEDPFAVATQLYQLYAGQPSRREDALKQLKEAYRLKPDNAGIVDRLFSATLVEKDWTLAQTLIDKAKEVGLDKSDGHYYRGMLLFAREDLPDRFAQAEREFREALQIFPDHSDGHAKLAQTLAALNRYDEAQKSATEALRLNPRNAMANFIMAFIAGARGDETTKLKYMSICRELGVNNPWLKQQQEAADETKDPIKGIARREELRKKEPENVENLVALANLYSTTGKTDQVVELMGECHQRQPESFIFAEQYASLLRRLDPPRYEDAEKALLETVEKRKDDTPDNRAIAQLLLVAHRENMARGKAPNAPTPEELDAAYTAVAEISDSAAILTRIADRFRRDNQPDKAEHWMRKAVASADRDKQTAAERQLRQQLIEFILLNRDPTRAKELLAEIEAYRAKFDDSFALGALSDHAGLTGRDYKALEYMNQYIAAEPNNPWGFFNRGSINARRSEWELAIKDYRSAKALDPKALNYQPRLNLVQCLLATGQNEPAISELTSIVDEAPTMHQAAQMLYDLYMRLGRYSEAEALIQPLHQREPQNPVFTSRLADIAWARQDGNQAIQLASEAAVQSKYEPVLLDRVLVLYMATNRFDDLIRYVGTLPEESQKHPNVLAHLGSAYAAKGDKDKAIESFMKSLDAVGSNVQGFLLVSRGILTSLKLTPAEATELINKRLAEHPDEPASLLVLATLARESGNMEGYQSQLRQLLAKLPQDNAELLPIRLDVMQRLALTLQEGKQFAEARKQYEELIALTPRNVAALNNLAYLLMENLNDPKSALPYAEEAAKLAPGQPNVLDTLGWNLILIGEDYDSAIAYLRHAALSSIGLDPRQASPMHYHAAFALWKRGQAENSAQDLAEAKTECTEAHRLIMEAKSDPDKLLPKVVDLGKQLGLDLKAELPQAEVTAAAK